MEKFFQTSNFGDNTNYLQILPQFFSLYHISEPPFSSQDIALCISKMAKSVRASVQKRNKAKLRSTVFGPAVDARTERLSAKLQELASQPKPSDQIKSKANMETTEMGMRPNLARFCCRQVLTL